MNILKAEGVFDEDGSLYRCYKLSGIGEPKRINAVMPDMEIEDCGLEWMPGDVIVFRVGGYEYSAVVEEIVTKASPT